MTISRPLTVTAPPLCSVIGLKYGYTPAASASSTRVKEKALSKMSSAPRRFCCPRETLVPVPSRLTILGKRYLPTPTHVHPLENTTKGRVPFDEWRERTW